MCMHALTRGCPSAGASVDNYFLGGMDTSLVKPPGHLDALNATAAKSGSGRLQAVFALQLPQSAATLANAATPVIYAVGPLDASGSLQQHAVSQARAFVISSRCCHALLHTQVHRSSVPQTHSMSRLASMRMFSLSHPARGRACHAQGVQDSITFTSGAGSAGPTTAPGTVASAAPPAAAATAPSLASGPQPASSASQSTQQQAVGIPAAGPSANVGMP